MAATTFAVNNSTVTTGTRTYTKQGETLKEAAYIDTSSSLTAPRTLILSRELKPVGGVGNDRHQIICRYVKIDVNGKAQMLSFNGVLSVPRSVVFTDAEVLDVVVNSTSFLTEARISAMADGVFPNA